MKDNIFSILLRILFQLLVSPLKKVKQGIEKKLLAEYLILSHQNFLHSTGFLTYWSKLNDKLEVSWGLETPFSNDKQPCSKVALRNIGNRQLEEVDMTVTVKDYYGYIYQQYIQIRDLGEKPHIYNLNNIPLTDFVVTEFGEIVPSHKEVFLTKIYYIKCGGVKQELNQVIEYRLVTSRYLFSEWDKKWDINWNIEFINEAKKKLHGEIYYLLLTPKQDWSIPKLNKLIYAFLTIPIVLNTVFWFLLFTRFCKISEDGNLYLTKSS